MGIGVWADLLGTLKTTFKVKLLSLDASALTAARSLTFADSLLTWAKAFKPLTLTPTPQSVAFSATPAIDVSLGNPIDMTLTANVTSMTFTGGVDGQLIILRLRQDATGGRTLAFGAGVRFGTDITSVVLSTAVSKLDRIGLQYDSTDGKYDVISFSRGY